MGFGLHLGRRDRYFRRKAKGRGEPGPYNDESGGASRLLDAEVAAVKAGAELPHSKGHE
jgi:hypothetical protein